ncbi:FtsK/SpoIIIE domain-containing protein [Alicyclobacillus vulcanalis]|uniref:FtsK/SpoIIIE family protein n=1 Tax=Alicyclobacillus vulcanalis TaxID=252246 RepID=A0A1N7PF82_9BACL|nr:FtsK/SpoIIIE domain-containing protein [Alicyclobacillus vulcanalis]SIT09197.1 FtsK/SpoIIIE family protein [Alicyclobacillus vulcanalis]
MTRLSRHFLLADGLYVLILFWVVRAEFRPHPWFVGMFLVLALLFRVGLGGTNLEEEYNPLLFAFWSWVRDPLANAYLALAQANGTPEPAGLVRLGRLKRRGRALVGLYRLPPGESFTSLREKERELASALGENLQITQTAWPGCVEIARFPALPRNVSLRDALPAFKQNTEGLSWCLGEGVQGPVLAPLRQYPHLLIAGATGGGKTNALKVIAETLKFQRPDATVVIADLKGGYDYKPLLDTVDEVIRDLPRLHAWMQTLVTTLAEREQEAWERGTTCFTPCVTLIDEFATITSTANSKVDKETAEIAKAILMMVNTILQKGRSLGLHLVIATQRPDADTIPGTLRANMDALLTFHVTTQVQSAVVLGPGHNEAFELPPIPGRALVSLGGQLEHVQMHLWR